MNFETYLMNVINNYKSNKNKIQDTNKDICNGRNCEEKSIVVLEESIGKYGKIILRLCLVCAKQFQK